MSAEAGTGAEDVTGVGRLSEGGAGVGWGGRSGGRGRGRERRAILEPSKLYFGDRVAVLNDF
jgi:hypothetical protein